ncbi:hypothetical protein BJV74DRAFT_881483 [Russula compacta]|nr:hypothetical protein BJV74DRAFT_881483 [Russula compacta]
MSQNPEDNQPYPLRLPNYRFLHQGRYHPYPTFNRQQGASTHEMDDIEIWDIPTIPTDEAGPSTQQGPPVTLHSQPAVNEQVDIDLANLAVIVEELEGTTSERTAPRDSVDLILACFLRLKSGLLC